MGRSHGIWKQYNMAFVIEWPKALERVRKTIIEKYKGKFSGLRKL